MFTESMFTAPRDAKPPEEDALSVWPALTAVAFAWVVALARWTIGRARHENLDLDLVLAVGSMLLIPAIILLFWRSARHARRAPVTGVPGHDRPVRLSLVASAPRAGARVGVSVRRRRTARMSAMHQ